MALRELSLRTGQDSELQQLLREPKLPKLCPELQMPLQRGEHLQVTCVVWLAESLIKGRV